MKLKLTLNIMLFQLSKRLFQLRNYNNNVGQVSIFLCIIMTSMLMILFLLADAARIKAAETEVQNAADRSLRSVLADNQPDLLTQYGIFASDFGGGKSRDTFESYLKLNLQIYDENKSRLIDYKVEDVEITSLYNLNDPLIFKKQILEFMKFRGPVYLSLEILEKIKALKQLDNVFTKEKETAEQISKEASTETKKDNKEDKDAKEQDKLPSKDQNVISRYKDLLDEINKNLKGQIRSEELIGLKDESSLDHWKGKGDYTDLIDSIDSYYEIDAMDSQGSESASMFQLRNFLALLDEPVTSARDTLYINEYILRQFSSFTGSKNNRELPRAEIEYLIFHNSSEKMNVIAAHALIGGLRFAIRFMETFIKNKISDIRARIIWSLLKGLYLSMDDLTRLFDTEYEKQHMGVELCDEYSNIRLTYKDYLRVLLFTIDEITLLQRMQELLQANINRNGQSKEPEFRLSECSTYMEGEVTVSLKLWFMSFLKLERFGNQNIRGGRYFIRKKVYCGY